jgi:WD40 repeat protein
MYGITSSWQQELKKMSMMLPFNAAPITTEIDAEDLADFSSDGFVELRAEAQAVEAPLCLAEHHQHYLAGMDILIEMLQDIQNGQLADPEPSLLVESDHEMVITMITLWYLAEMEERYPDILDELSVDAIGTFLSELTYRRRSMGFSPFLMNDYFPGLPEPSVVELDFLPDGRRFLILGEETLFIADAESGERILDLVNSSNSKCSMDEYSISPDGDALATTGCSGVCVWDTVSAAAAADFPSDPDSPYCPRLELVFSPDSACLVVAPNYNDLNVHFYDVESGQELLELPESDSMDNWTFSPDGQQILALDYDSADVWDTSTGEKLMTLSGVSQEDTLSYLEGPEVAAFGPNGDVIITAGCGSFEASLDRCGAGFIRIWDAQSGEMLQELHGHSSEITDFDISGDGKVLVTVGKDNAAILWDLESGEELETLHHNHIPDGYSLLEVEFCPNDEFLLTHSAAAVATTWDIENSQILHSYDGIGSAGVSPDGNRILMSNLRGQIAIVDVETGDVVWEMWMPVD